MTKLQNWQLARGLTDALGIPELDAAFANDTKRIVLTEAKTILAQWKKEPNADALFAEIIPEDDSIINAALKNIDGALSNAEKASRLLGQDANDVAIHFGNRILFAETARLEGTFPSKEPARGIKPRGRYRDHEANNPPKDDSFER